MESLDEMTTNIHSIYRRYLNTNRGGQYALARLWEDYYDEDPDEEMLIYNMIIAKINLEQQSITSNNWKCISRVTEYYEKNKEKVEMYYSQKDSINICRIYNKIKNAVTVGCIKNQEKKDL